MRAFQIFGSTNKVGCKNEIIIIKKQIKAPKKLIYHYKINQLRSPLFFLIILLSSFLLV